MQHILCHLIETKGLWSYTQSPKGRRKNAPTNRKDTFNLVSLQIRRVDDGARLRLNAVHGHLECFYEGIEIRKNGFKGIRMTHGHAFDQFNHIHLDFAGGCKFSCAREKIGILQQAVTGFEVKENKTMQELEPASQYPVTASPEAMEQYHMQDELQKRNWSEFWERFPNTQGDNDRQAFVVKVLGILTAQMAMTFTFVTITVMSSTLQAFFKTAVWLLIPVVIG